MPNSKHYVRVYVGGMDVAVGSGSSGSSGGSGSSASRGSSGSI